ncbi:flagellar filament capping protein FliD [Echinimonas agarilytica]|uniref:Flagellar hook-associated protein 2 n=1 Tax=Echinimonas agarilytica TaxID=1215918 RepID=A0AA41W4S8_9GAMM|nr:flagellar filament capping protein FliD [Echinimonas agarilytica]MCM2678957.1 flagellar filament capping protein FliD [Echinimonas agarilytica]
MSTISTPGIGSGIDINAIVGAYIDASRVPFEERTAEKQSTYTNQITGYGTLQSAVDSLKTSLTKLADPDLYSGMSMSMSSASNFSAKIDDTADIGSFELEVKQLAEAQKLTSTGFVAEDAVGEGSLELSLGSSSFTIDIAADATIEDIKNAINDADSNPGISASIVTDDTGSHLVLNSTETGTDNQINITAFDAGGTEITDGTGLGQLQFDSTDVANSQMSETQAAQDAIVIIDGSLTVTNSSNTIENAIQGVTLDLKSANDDGDTTTITISEDNSQVENAVKAFIDAYNGYTETSKSLQYVNLDAEITAPLNGDSTVRMMDRQFRELASSAFGSGVFTSLSQLGITTNEEGYLDLDSDVLSDAVKNNKEDLQSFFVGTESEPGLAVSFEEKISVYSGADGIVSTRINTLTGQVERLDIETETFNERLATQEEQLYSRFNAMDITVASLQNTLSFVTSQLSNLPGVVSQDS